MSRAEELAQLRQDWVNAGKEQAGLESKKEALLDQKQKAIDEAVALGVAPQKIDDAIAEAEQTLDLVIQKMNSIKVKAQGGTQTTEDVMI